MRTISISLALSSENAYVALFANAVASTTQKVIPFSWRATTILRSDVIIFHWPTFAFSKARGLKAIKHRLFLWTLLIARGVLGKRIIWVAHNAVPHDGELQAAKAKTFVKTLSGVIFLSQTSKAEISELYEDIRLLPSLTVRHGHYLDVAVTAPTLKPAIPPLQIGFVGRVRPYKGVENAIAACRTLTNVQLMVTGKVRDASYRQTLERMTTDTENIELRLYDRDLSNEELEQAIDRCDGIVLPYRNVLNSGSLFMALSRGRRVLAPAAGSLPEVRGEIGEECIQPYDGDIKATIVSRFAAF